MTSAAFTPSSHPSIETLTSYAAGAMRPGFDFVLAAHLQACATCRATVQELQALGGAFLADGPAARLESDALARALARIDAPVEDAPAPPVRSIQETLAAARRRWVAPGVWVAKVPTPHLAGDRVYLLGASKGAKTARHGHGGLEFTQVLEGALGDEDTVYRAGDFCENDEDRVHHPHVVGDTPCICLFATQGRLEPSGLLGRLAFMLADV